MLLVIHSDHEMELWFTVFLFLYNFLEGTPPVIIESELLLPRVDDDGFVFFPPLDRRPVNTTVYNPR